MTVAAILLAAGASSRMGSPKPLLPWAGTTLVEWELAQLRASGVGEIVVVLGARAEAVRRVLLTDPATLVFNARWAQGRATSLAAGARALLSLAPDLVVIENVDQPAPASLVARLIEATRSAGADAVQPVYLDADGAEHGGHPVVLRGAVLPALALATEASEGLRGVLAGRAVHRVRIGGEPATAWDLDTPEAYEAARTAFGG
ncbi:MAG: molybdopterin-guanine dinucleotide biosynthesis protein A [Chloroflexi bacterium HGW-Chloroflexi-9]|nr:MAG: molybdopterin-guanine dinucleotide biosynthesis protein A [Chloroflexi bacterium HGW-Chloroflexi-9]